MIDWIKEFWDELLLILLEMSPYLLLGFFFAGLLHIFFPKEKVSRHLGKDNRMGVVNAALLGIPLPLCSCGVIPTGISFYKHGASKGSTISFFISTPQTGIDSILVTYSLLGLPFALIRPVVAFVSGIFGGWLTGKITRKEKTENKKDNTTEEKENSSLSAGKKIHEMFRYAFVEFLQDISKWLIIGMLLAALMAVLIPDDFFGRYLDDGLLSMLVILAASIPLYICATGSVPIAAVLMMKGLSPGAALVLLMAGPATNMATITLISKVLGKKTLFSYLFSITSMAIIFGLAINAFLPAAWFALPIDPVTGHNTHEVLPRFVHIGSTILLTLLIINGYVMKFLHSKKIQKAKEERPAFTIDPSQTRVIVRGMTCNHCKANVEKAITSLPGIEKAEADVSSGEVIVRGDKIDYDLIRESVESVGYEFGGRKNV